MTPASMIDRLDAMLPNGYGPDDKLEWLTEIDGRVKNEILATHELGDGEEMPEAIDYNGSNMDSVELLIDKPYTDVYLYWLQSKVHYFNQETNHYNNAMTMFNTAWTTYANHHRRTHLPVRVERKWF